MCQVIVDTDCVLLYFFNRVSIFILALLFLACLYAVNWNRTNKSIVCNCFGKHFFFSCRHHVGRYTPFELVSPKNTSWTRPKNYSWIIPQNGYSLWISCLPAMPHRSFNRVGSNHEEWKCTRSKRTLPRSGHEYHLTAGRTWETRQRENARLSFAMLLVRCVGRWFVHQCDCSTNSTGWGKRVKHTHSDSLFSCLMVGSS